VLKVDYFIGLRPTHFMVSEISAHERRNTSTGRKNPLPSASRDLLWTVGTVVYVF